ncbi:MAG: hypothetical protein Kow0063_36880 [Anaerolineae bacterium]
MSKTNKERILDYLWSIAPERATNSQIRESTNVSSHQQVYLLTQGLMYKGYIRGEQRGHEWVFWADESLAAQFTSPGPASPRALPIQAGPGLTPGGFEKLAQQRMSEHFGVSLTPGTVPGVPKQFDLVSPDKEIVGDAKYYTLVRGQRLPPAKFSVIAEHVWLLEKTGAPTRFLVFGNDRQVPELWLKRYASLAPDVVFYFLSDDGMLEQLNPSGEH